LKDGSNKKILLQTNETDPRALALDGNNLYVGLRGGPHIIKIDIASFAVVGYIRLPLFLYSIETATAYNGMVYFATNEPHGKILRVNEYDFCHSPCPMNSYCESPDTCLCMSGYKVSSDKQSCELVITTVSETVYEKEKGAAIAMGILWAVTLIAAVAGWVLWYRSKKRNPYESL
jgi:hypothetical protein